MAQKTKEEKAAYQRSYYHRNIDKCRETSRKTYYRTKKTALVGPKTKEEKAEYNRLRYHAIREREAKKNTIETFKKRKSIALFFVLDTLKKDLKHPLWNKSVTIWNDTDWFNFNQLKND